MRRWLAPLFAFAIVCASSQPLRADARVEVIHPWEGVGQGFIGSYEWPTLLFHVSAVALTPPLVFTVDRPVQKFFQKQNPFGQPFGDAMLGIGWFTPVVIPLALYLGGLAGDASELATAGAAALQAAAVQVVIVTALKWLTDRSGQYPNGDPAKKPKSAWFHDTNDPKDFDFNPFDISGRLLWPSGHTASNIALVSALVAFYPNEIWLPLVGYPAVLAIALGLLDGDYHWFTDIVAGALMGHAIGWTIGKQFRSRYDAAISGKPQPHAELQFQPLLSMHSAGVSLVYAH